MSHNFHNHAVPHFAHTLRRLATASLALLAVSPLSLLAAEPATAVAAAPLDPFTTAHCVLVGREGSADAPATFNAGEGGVVVCRGEPVGYLATREGYSDFELTLDWRWTGKPGNSGILVALGEPSTDRVWPRCVQVQLKANAAGELIPMEGFPSNELKPGAKSVPRAAEVTEAKPGEWNTCRVVVHAGTVECWINGVAACRLTGCGDTAGRIGLQLEGAPFEYRNVALQKK